MKMNRSQWTTVGLIATFVGALVGGTYYLTNRQVTPPPAAKVAKKIAKKVVVHAPKCVCLPVVPAAPAPPATPATPKKGLTVVIEESTPPVPPVAAPAAPKSNNGRRPVTTKDGWIQLGPPSSVPPPKVPVKGIEGPDVR